jgi:hypothetical protein
MENQDTKDLVEYIKSNPKATKQVMQILNALMHAQIHGKAIVSPESEDAPIVVISYDRDTKDAVEKMLEGTGKKASWDKE